MFGLRLGVMGLIPRRSGASGPVWLSLVQQAEAAAAAAGASLWYVPPASYADRAVNGPFVGSDGSGGNPALGSGVAGWVRDAAAGPVNTPNLATTPYTGTTSGAWTFGADIRRNGTTTQPASINSVAGMTAAGTYLFTFTLADFSGDGFTLAANGQSLGVGQITGNGPKSFVGTIPASGSPSLQLIPWNGTAGQATITNLSVRRVLGNHATQSTSANRPVLVAAPGADAAFLGPELVLDPGFNNPAAWSILSAAASVAGGVLAFDGSTSVSAGVGLVIPTPSISIVAGKVYQVTYTINSGTTNPVSVGFSTGSVLGTARTGAGTYTETLVATSNANLMVFSRGSVGVRSGSIDNISVREVPTGAEAGFGALSFDGSNDFLQFVPPVSAYPMSLIAAVSAPISQEGGILSLAESDTVFKQIGRWSVAGQIQTNDRQAVNSALISSDVNTSAYVHQGRFESALFRVIVNGTQIGATGHSSTFGTPTFGFIGKTRPSGLFFSGIAGLLAVVPATATQAQREAIERLGAYIVGAPYPGL